MTIARAEFTEWLLGFRSWAGKSRGGSAAWREAARQGVVSLAVPEELGGAGAGYEAACVALEALAEETGQSGLAFSLAAQMWACQEPISAFGTAIQRQRYLAPLLAGDAVGGFAATEYDAGSDLLSLRTTATQETDGSWLLNGTKAFVTNGPSADIFVVLARTGEGSSLAAFTAFLVPRGTAGFSIGRRIEKGALDGAELCSLQLTDCRLPTEALLAGVGDGFAVLMHAMRYERAFILAPSIGLMARALKDGVEHVRMRQQFGRPLSANDAIRQRVVEMYMSLTSAREFLRTSARAADLDSLDHQRASLTKLHVSTEFRRFCSELPDLYGGYSILPETGALRLVADAVASRYYSGTSDMQMKIIAEGLGL
ncbi:acyl-CoA dehydrogenase family protein [Streptomyces griseofuscus]|uniref:acyl-CoA dehydrogenase family protein n=1 Tax=Streptomyces griseofuscus TaxID=146922 RepID=UPI003452BCD5